MIYSVIVFVKNPVEGRVKTRIAATVGHAQAVAVYKELLAHTHRLIGQLVRAAPPLAHFRVNVYYGDEVNPSDLWNDLPVRKVLQVGQDLGERMKNAFAEEFEAGAQQVLIIGSDCLSIKFKHIKNAFDELSTHDVVIGPATDGGYYLLAMKQLHETLFENKPWSQPTLLKETLQDLQQQKVALLEPLTDIDTWEDYLNAKEKLE